MPTPSSLAKVVVFDLGKVLVDFDYSIAAHKIATRSRPDVDESRLFLDQSPLLHRYETGLLTTEQFFDEIRGFSGFSGTEAEFASFFSDIFSPIDEMICLHEELRAVKIPTFIFSNTNPLAVTHIRERYSFFKNFDGYVLSYECGYMKPKEEIYQAVERMTGCRGREIAYIDDRLENVQTGLTRNWNAILHESPEKTRATLMSLGFLNSHPTAGA